MEKLNDLEQIQKTILSLRKLIQSMSFRVDAEEAYQEFIRNASVLYSLILEDALTNVDASIDGLIIIPDGSLWLTPSETLLYDQASTNRVNFGTDNLPYLLKKILIFGECPDGLPRGIRQKFSDLKDRKSDFLG